MYTFLYCLTRQMLKKVMFQKIVSQYLHFSFPDKDKQRKKQSKSLTQNHKRTTLVLCCSLCNETQLDIKWSRRWYMNFHDWIIHLLNVTMRCYRSNNTIHVFNIHWAQRYFVTTVAFNIIDIINLTQRSNHHIKVCTHVPRRPFWSLWTSSQNWREQKFQIC